MPRIYIAGPLFTSHERWCLERIAEAPEGAGYTAFLPHRDAGLVDFTAPYVVPHTIAIAEGV